MPNTKPITCSGCSLEHRGRGYVPPIGPQSSPILFVGEAAGWQEATYGEPFYPLAPAGGMLNRLLSRNHWDRRSYRIDNQCRCEPPGDWFDERAPWYWTASQHCKAVHLDETLAEGHRVVVPIGGTALRQIMGLHKGIKLDDWHGTVSRDPTDRFWVVPTYHTSHIVRGAHNLFGVASFDLQVAHDVAAHGYVRDEVAIIVDPSVEWFTWWVETVEAAVAQDPAAVWLMEDIETPDKSDGQDEGQLSAEDRSYIITRVNFSVHPDEGISVPYQGPYVALVDRLIRLPCVHGLWNKEYDDPRLLAAGHTFGGERYDGMWMAHYLQSDLPRGLGFWAPFYCRWGPWKHLAKTEPGFYAACDGFKTYRTVAGIAKDLMALGMWEDCLRHVHQVHKLALHPAQLVGVKIDRQRLKVFVHDLEVKQRRLLHEMQACVPEADRPLTPKQGLKTPPAEGVLHTKGTELNRDGTTKKEAPDPIKQELYAQVAQVVARTVRTTGFYCLACDAAEVTRKHRCAGTKGDNPARLELRELDVTRYFWQEPFNPDSPDQILAYIKRRGHTPGRAKKTGNESTDKETLTELAAKTKDPLYRMILQSRAVGKVKGTYGVGTLKRMDQNDRVHPTPTFKPSTHRLSYVNPNITNVIADKDEKENLAAGFRACIVADQEEPELLPGYGRWVPELQGYTRPVGPAVVSGTRLFEADYAGIEAVLSGWYMHDPSYIRLARLGVHAGLASHILGRPYDPDWPDAQIAAYFKEIKTLEPLVYDRSKRNVHGRNYGLTIYGMVRNFPETFPTLKVAKHYSEVYDRMAPGLPTWHGQVRELAYKQNFLGGPGAHPFGYKHWFWAVLAFKGITYPQYVTRQQRGEPVTMFGDKYYAVILGDDSKRCLPPTSQVWMGDYTYKNIGDVQVGDTVIGWQRRKVRAVPARETENTQYAKRPKAFLTDQLVRTTVLDVHNVYDRLLTIHLASGKQLRCTADHQWLCLSAHKMYDYRRADTLRVGSQICMVDTTDPGDCPTHLRETAAWLAGFYDGEGSHRGLTQALETHGGLLQRAEEAFAVLGFRTTRQTAKREPDWKDCCFLGWLGGRQEALRFRRWVPSWRYRTQWADKMILSSRFRRLDTVVRITHGRLHEHAVCITTDTGNFIADDACSHNCIAFYPQSTAAGVLKEAMLRLFDPELDSYVGDAYYGRTPLRAPIHDSLLFEIPNRVWDRVTEIVYREMLRPVKQLPMTWCDEATRAACGLGPYLTIGVDGKQGLDWKDMQKMPSPTLQELGVSPDGIYQPADAGMGYGTDQDDEELTDALGTVA